MHSNRILHIKNFASLKHILFLGILWILMQFFILPDATKYINFYANGTSLINLFHLHSPSEIYELMDAYGIKGRTQYIVVEATVDLVLSIILSLLLCASLIWTTFKSRHRVVKMKSLIWLPILFLLANCMENFGIIWMLIKFPEFYYWGAILTIIFTILKLIFLCICLFLIGFNMFRIMRL